MKKFIALILAVLMIGSVFAGCGSSQAADDTDYSTMTIDELKPLIKTITEGKLTMVTSPDMAPYEFYALDDAGTPTLAGFDIAMGHYIADFLGLELEIVPMDFDGTIAEIGSKKADIGMAGYSPDPKREKAMSFSDIYYMGAQSFVTTQENASKFASLEDVNKPEYKIGAQIGSIQANLAKENAPDADIVELSKLTDIVAELVSGKLDGAFIETLPAQSYAKNYPELAVILDVPYDAAGNVVGVNKDNAPLLAAVNLAIKAAQEDGSLEDFIFEATELAAGDIHEGLLETEPTASASTSNE